MKKQPLVSVVIPIYNVEAFVKRCVDSILKQTYQNIQIILVDDGSTDSSGDIIQQYKDRAIIVKQKNKGLSAARNAGVSYANGKYLMYVDSDDYLNSDAVATLVERMELTSSDICCFRAYTKDKNGRLYNIGNDFTVSNICNNYDIVRDALLGINIKTTVTSKMYLLSIIRENNITFLDGVINEDYIYMSQVVLYVKKASFINTPFYYVERRPSSISRSFKDINITTIVHHYKYLREIYAKSGKLEQFERFLYCQYLIANLFALYTIAYNINKFSSFLHFYHLIDKEEFNRKTAKSTLLLKGRLYPILYSIYRIPILFYITVKIAKKSGLMSYV